MTHNPSRKHFFARLAGVAAVAGIFPKLFAKSGLPGSQVKTSGGPAAPVVRADPRAVARRADTI